MDKAKRKKAQDYILDMVKKIAKGPDNYNLYKTLFDNMSDKEFHEFMVRLRDKKITLSVIVPHNDSVKISVENNFKVAKSIGLEFFQHLSFGANGDIPAYITPNKYLVYKLPIKRAAQLLTKKISIPEDDQSINVMTGQVTGKSKSSKLTLPEIQILIGLGLNESIKELVKIRGGDQGAANAYNNLLYKQGYATQEQIEQYSTGVVSTKTLRNFLLGAHIRSSL
jgi:hypothetical protein